MPKNFTAYATIFMRVHHCVTASLALAMSVHAAFIVVLLLQIGMRFYEQALIARIGSLSVNFAKAAAGATDVLTRLHAAGVPCAVATNDYEKFAVAQFVRVGRLLSVLRAASRWFQCKCRHRLFTSAIVL